MKILFILLDFLADMYIIENEIRFHLTVSQKDLTA